MDNNKIYRLNKYLIVIFLIYVTYKFVLIPFLSEPIGLDLGLNYRFLTPDDAHDIGFKEDAMIYKGDFSNTIIYPTVVDVVYDDDFILAVQRNRKNNSLNYFIINKKIDSLYGPYNKYDFNQIRKKLNVSKELAFDSSYMK
jgi:hypothetical protein